jgi:hypothetical protein
MIRFFANLKGILPGNPNRGKGRSFAGSNFRNPAISAGATIRPLKRQLWGAGAKAPGGLWRIGNA